MATLVFRKRQKRHITNDFFDIQFDFLRKLPGKLHPSEPFTIDYYFVRKSLYSSLQLAVLFCFLENLASGRGQKHKNNNFERVFFYLNALFSTLSTRNFHQGLKWKVFLCRGKLLLLSSTFLFTLKA